jgi:hypothetical protein
MSRTARSLVASALVSVVFLSGCALSPTTTISRPDGTDVTVSWEDYPGSAGVVAADVLAAPRENDVETAGAALFTALRETLDEQFDLQWKEHDEDGWYPEDGNGYGGESMLITYNSRSIETDSAPSSPSDWRSIIERVSAVTEASGLGPIVLDHDEPPVGTDEAVWRREYHDRFGTKDPDRYWMWTGTAYGDSQWLAVWIIDGDRDQTGKAVDELGDGPTQSIGFSYGVTTVPDKDRDAFVRALKPFAGLEKPPASHSD